MTLLDKSREMLKQRQNLDRLFKGKIVDGAVEAALIVNCQVERFEDGVEEMSTHKRMLLLYEDSDDDSQVVTDRDQTDEGTEYENDELDLNGDESQDFNHELNDRQLGFEHNLDRIVKLEESRMHKTNEFFVSTSHELGGGDAQFSINNKCDLITVIGNSMQQGVQKFPRLLMMSRSSSSSSLQSTREQEVDDSQVSVSASADSNRDRDNSEIKQEAVKAVETKEQDV